MRAAIYARVSTLEQEPENQLQELRRYCELRGWTLVEYVDRGVSGAKDRRPALDELLRDAKRRRFDVLVCWRLDRLGRNLRHLIRLLDELQALGVGFVTLNEGIDTSTPAGKLQLHILSAIAEFERARPCGPRRTGSVLYRPSWLGLTLVPFGLQHYLRPRTAHGGVANLGRKVQRETGLRQEYVAPGGAGRLLVGWIRRGGQHHNRHGFRCWKTA